MEDFIDFDKTIIGAECDNLSHAGLTSVMHGARLPDDSLGQDSAFVAFLLEGYEALVGDLEKQVEHLAVSNSTFRNAIAKHSRLKNNQDLSDLELHSVLDN
jgi:hypothetical protein